MIIKTSNIKSAKNFINKLYIPAEDSYKGQNGRVLIIGGSSLFHSSSIWSAEIASHFVDIVHYSSTVENARVFLSLKKKFQNGIVVSQKNLHEYVREDDAILIGPGMLRTDNSEGQYTYKLTKDLIDNFPEKKFIFDAGALQTMDKKWLLRLKTKPILTPHSVEFAKLFDINVKNHKIGEIEKIVKETAKKYHCIILLKTKIDVISDGIESYIVKGGNAGLTKGGTGDLLAGLVLSLFAKNDQLLSAILSSYFLKKTADSLFIKKGYWYNIDDLIETIPQVISKLTKI